MQCKSIVAAMVAMSLATPVLAAEGKLVKEIDVGVELTALANPAAAERFATLETDLEAAIAARLTGQLAEEGVKISVDISEIELGNAFEETFDLADSRLVGLVKITDENNNTNFDTYKLTVDMAQSRLFLPLGVDVVVLAADRDAYYDAMVAAFADHVARRVAG